VTFVDFVDFFNHSFEISFFDKLMTYSGLVSGYIWSKKAKKKKDNLFIFKQKIFFKLFKYRSFNFSFNFFLLFFLIISACIYTEKVNQKKSNLMFTQSINDIEQYIS